MNKQDTFVYDLGDIKPLALQIHAALRPVMESLDKRGFGAFMIALDTVRNSLAKAGDYHHAIGDE